MILVFNCGIEKTGILQIPLKHQWVRCLIDDGKVKDSQLEKELRQFMERSMTPNKYNFSISKGE
jgi:hypothetical protein